MGVPTLWPILNNAGESRALAQLAVVDGFDKNKHDSRSFRLGIDAGIWLHHAMRGAGGKDDYRGDSPELATLFYRLCRFSRLPFSLLFIFDGRARPHLKRGSRVGKSGSHAIAPQFKKLITLFGMDCREAAGEAEAELARLNYEGSIDAVLTDDVDTLIFGARMVLKNVSLNLTGNAPNPALNGNGKPCNQHANVYTAEALAAHPEVQLARGGLILIALFAGGDYDSGVFGVGVGISHGLARAGFGDQLLEAYTTLPPAVFQAWLPGWRTRMAHELHNNASGLLPCRSPSRFIPSTFPPLDTLKKYVHPTLQPHSGGPPRDRCAVDLRALAAFCETHFTEWGIRTQPIPVRLHDLLYHSLALCALRRAALTADRKEVDQRIAAGARPLDAKALVRGLWGPTPAQAVGTPAPLVKACAAPLQRTKAAKEDQMRAIAAAFVNQGRRVREPDPQEEEDAELLRQVGAGRGGEETHPLVVGITRTRQHVSTGKLLEYRVEICVEQFHEITLSGLKNKDGVPVAGPSRVQDPGRGRGRGRGGYWGRGRGRGRGTGRSRGRGRGRGRGNAAAPRGEGGRPGYNNPFEGTEDEDEPAPAPEPPFEAPNNDNSGADDGEPGAKKARKNVDPRANMLLWVPASIMRHAHPALVAEYEAKKGKKAPGAPRRRAAAAVDSDSEQDPAVEADPAPSRARATTSKSKGKSKGKEKAQPAHALDASILRANPHASTAPPRTAPAVAALSSLPLRSCGFLFTWPDPCDPDILVVDTEDRDDLITTVDYAAVKHAGGAGDGEYDADDDAAAVPSVRSRAKAMTHKAQPLADVAARKDKGKGRAPREQPVPDPRDWSFHDDYVDRAPASTPGGRKRKPRGSTSAADGHQASASGVGKPTKRRKTTHNPPPDETLDVNLDDVDIDSDSSDELELPWKSHPENHLNHPPLDRSPSPVYIPPSSPVPGPPPSSSPGPTSTRSSSVRSLLAASGRRKSVVPDDAEVISISSDSDGLNDDAEDDGEGWHNLPMFTRPSLYSQRKASSSYMSLADALADADLNENADADAMDAGPYPWEDPVQPLAKTKYPPTGAGPSTQRASGSASAARVIPASGRRVFRAEPVPASSQESMLDADVDVYLDLT